VILVHCCQIVDHKKKDSLEMIQNNKMTIKVKYSLLKKRLDKKWCGFCQFADCDCLNSENNEEGLGTRLESVEWKFDWLL
jgi:hypothetical protein